MTSNSRNHIVVFSGGSAANSLVDVFGKVAQDKGCTLTYIIPISDNGGSSSELIRMFGGPGIGDVRSRLIRLIPPTPTNTALLTLLSYRLPSSQLQASTEWHEILHGFSSLWTFIPSPTRELIRSFLNHLNAEIVKRSRPPHSVFNFSSASIGNLFLTGARLFTGSFEAAIHLLAVIGGLDESKTQVVPAINSNFSHHISAYLRDGTVITGQNAISHPSERVAGDPLSFADGNGGSGFSVTSTAIVTPVLPAQSAPKSSSMATTSDGEKEAIEDATLPCSLPTLRTPNIVFHKSGNTPLSSPINRIWYINPYGQPIQPAANPKALSVLEEASYVIYSIGSLYSSIVPCLILKGVGDRIRGMKETRRARAKILILNGCNDRETTGYSAKDFVRGVVDAASGSSPPTSVSTSHPHPHPHLAISSQSAKPFLPAALIQGEDDDEVKEEKEKEKENESEEEEEEEDWRDYITHLIYMEGEGVPIVDRDELGKRGIECVRIYGRKNEADVGDGGMIYDGAALGQALDAIIGRSQAKGGKERRNTLGK